MKGIGNWGGGGGWGLLIHNLYIYICYVKVGKLGFCERGFSNLLALKMCIFMRGDLIKAKVMAKGHQCFLLLKIFFCVHKNAVIKKCNPFYALKRCFTPLLAKCFSKINKCLKYLKELSITNRMRYFSSE